MKKLLILSALILSGCESSMEFVLAKKGMIGVWNEQCGLSCMSSGCNLLEGESGCSAPMMCYKICKL